MQAKKMASSQFLRSGTPPSPFIVSPLKPDKINYVCDVCGKEKIGYPFTTIPLANAKICDENCFDRFWKKNRNGTHNTFSDDSFSRNLRKRSNSSDMELDN